MKKLQTICIIRIQALWRGVVGRLYTDKLWLNKIVIPLQSIYRRLIAQKRFQLIKKEFNLASTIIQKKFRNYYSKIKMGDKLFHREMQYRMNNIRLLTSEEELCQEFLTKSMERLKPRPSTNGQLKSSLPLPLPKTLLIWVSCAQTEQLMATKKIMAQTQNIRLVRHILQSQFSYHVKVLFGTL